MKILGGGTDHRRSADVDVLDQLFDRDARPGCGFFEGVEIDHDHVDRPDAVLGYGCDVRGNLAAMQDAAVHLGMQRLNAAIKHFRKSSQLGMSLTAMPESRSSLAVPPVEMSSTPRPESWRAKPTNPVLSVTLRTARWILGIVTSTGIGLSEDFIRRKI